jgi:hypothetical protein
MMSKHDNPPAFPTRYADDPLTQGMTLRDWFAGQALAGIMAQSSQALLTADARFCYEMADAMLAERAKTEGKQ